MSEIKVNKISPRTACGTTTLGDSGDTFTIPAGVSITNSGTASGFGATGAVSWNTTVKTSGFTAVAGEGYFVNTTGGAVSVNLPAGTAGAVVGIKDYAKTFDSNAVTLVQNGSDKIGGSTTNATLSTEGLAVTLVFIDSTQGWLVTDSGLQDEAPTEAFITATGGTITTCGNFKIHKFTGPGTFTVCSVGNACGSNTVSYVVVAGAGGGGGSALGFYSGGGGGAGGFRESKAASDSYTTSPLNATSGPTYNLPVSATGYPITVGAGGTGGGGSPGPAGPACRSPGNPGSNSVFSTITSARGGAGGESGSDAGQTPNGGCAGGSGGGGGGYNSNPDGGLGAGNSPPVSPPQGNPGGAGSIPGGGHGGGGGGATTAGTGTAGSPSGSGNAGGAGAATQITGSAVTYSAGGPAGVAAPIPAAPDAGANTGTGGPGGYANPSDAGGGNGGSGIVIIRYKFQN